VEQVGKEFYCDCKLGMKGKLCMQTIALTYDRVPEFEVDPRLNPISRSWSPSQSNRRSPSLS
jgi:hypothetical protein